LPINKIESLAEALLDFKGMADLEIGCERTLCSWFVKGDRLFEFDLTFKHLSFGLLMIDISSHIESLAEALLDFTRIDYLEIWLKY
jgi:hypothetical protein